MIICVDIDNTINNLQEAVIKLFNERYGTKYTLNDFTEYNVENVLPVSEAMSMQAMYGETGLYNSVRPIHGAQDALQKLINEGHSVYLVTDAIPSTYDEKVKWVRHFFPFIDNAHIVAMKHKNLFKCDVMIEDNMQNLLAGVHYHRICIDYPWNRDTTDYVYDIHRCSTWKQVMSVVNKINNEE